MGLWGEGGRVTMPDDASRRWMTYAEIALTLGLPSAKAGESKARRASGSGSWGMTALHA